MQDEREAVGGSSDPPPAEASASAADVGMGPSEAGGSAASMEIAALLEEHMFAKTESKKEIYEISQLLCTMGIHKSDAAEIYNPKRFVSRAKNLRPGFAIDLSVVKKGEHWNLSREEDQRELKRTQRRERPLFLIGSPPCGPFSPLQNLSKDKRTEEENQANPGRRKETSEDTNRSQY